MFKSMRVAEHISAYISLGSNLGDPAANLDAARAALAGPPGLMPDQPAGIRLGLCSPVYRTEPQGLKDQPWFANQVAELICPAGLDPRLLLRSLLALENALGRRRAPGAPRHAPRVIDLDLLLMGGITRNEPDLILPHPRLHLRAFVLVPLLDIAPNLVLPCGCPAREALRGLDYAVRGEVIYQD